MTFSSKIIITGLVIVGFDALTSFLSKRFQFDYTSLIWASFLIYAAAGYWGAHRRGFLFGVLLGALAGLVDSTIGWFVSMSIGPFISTGVPPVTPLLILVVVISVAATGIVFGLVGAGLCAVFGQTRPPQKSLPLS